MPKPLEGIRVLDLTHMLPGPFCTMMLADMGAEVIKVENPNGGDSFRTRKPLKKNEGTAFLMLNRNKKSVVVDLKTEEGRNFFMKLASTADIVFEQFKPGTVKKLGIDYEQVKAHNPSIIYCSLTGYGQEGPYALMPGHDINYLSLSGVLDTIGQVDSAPMLPGIQIADLGGGAQWSLIALLLAILQKKNTGEGCYLDVSMTRCVVPWMSLYLSQYAADGTVPQRGTTKAGGHYACYRIYETSDGRYVSMGAAEPKFWAKFCEIVGRPDLIEDQYAEGDRRLELIGEVSALFQSQPQAHWCDLLMNENVCFTPVRSFDEVMKDEALIDESFVGTYAHPIEGDVLNLGFPVDIPGVDTTQVSPAPLFGGDTEAYLQELGYSTEEAAAYLDAIHR